MNKFIKGIRWFFSNPRCVFYLGLVIAIVATTLEVSRSRARNFYDFYDLSYILLNNFFHLYYLGLNIWGLG